MDFVARKNLWIHFRVFEGLLAVNEFNLAAHPCQFHIGFLCEIREAARRVNGLDDRNRAGINLASGRPDLAPHVIKARLSPT